MVPQLPVWGARWLVLARDEFVSSRASWTLMLCSSALRVVGTRSSRVRCRDGNQRDHAPAPIE